VIVLWLNRFTANRNSYKFIVEFANAGGMQRGAPVRYRGVRVGNIARVQPGPNAVQVEIEIAPANLIIPRNVVIEANQSGLISESIIDIVPRKPLPAGITVAGPLDNNCDEKLIICQGSRLSGDIGISIDELIRTSTNLARTYEDPQFYRRLNQLLESSTVAATSVAELSQDIRGLSQSLEKQLGTFASTANSVQRATNELTASTTRTVDQLGVTAGEFSTTATQANQLLNNLDDLVTTNRSTLVGALNNITETSNQLRVTVSSLSPAVNQLTQGELLKNLESLSENAAQASANLRDASQSLNNPQNLLLVQQTLDSARVTFENTQKITSDLDELTGDPAFRQNLRQLVNGLSGLVSSTEQMQEQVKIATTLDSVKAEINQPVVKTPTTVKKSPVRKPPVSIPPVNQPDISISLPNSKQQVLNINSSPTGIEITPPIPQASPVITESPQEKLLKQLRQHGEERKLHERD
jgi:phospholipid/cholesterol/gamma-HCH transport system substrate-binding protein